MQRRPARVLLIGGTSEIGLAILTALRLPAEADVMLAGRDADRLRLAAATLPARVTVLPYDATDPAAHEKLVAEAFAGGPVDVVISAAGVLAPRPALRRGWSGGARAGRRRGEGRAAERDQLHQPRHGAAR